MTYGGWAQTQSLGLRIARILNSKHDVTPTKSATNLESTNNLPQSPPRAQRIVIHSSPFLRCVQTSIGISAGIGQYTKDEPTSQVTRPSPLSKPALTLDLLENNCGEDHSGNDALLPTKLRVDAFLGEWLCPEYFEEITPPPSSFLMVANAKADLMRPAEEIRGADLSPRHNGRLPTGWSIDSSEVIDQAMPFRTRAATTGSEKKPHPHIAFHGIIQEEGALYAPPIPTYAISPSESIPPGFVAHARDACVDIDHVWDSMRAPLEWGTGGEFGEEWGGMHKRFRNGLQKMLNFYEGDDDTSDLTLILVTHGAGCNALIGAMTSAPVLLDVGVASLTLAARKEPVKLAARSPSRRRTSVDLGIANQFDMKTIASSEHLRSNPNPLGLNSPRLGRSPAFASRKMVGPESFDGFSIGDPLSWRPSSSSGLGPSASQGTTSMVLPASTGLWRSQSSRDEMTESTESASLPKSDLMRKGGGLRLNNAVVTDNAELSARSTSQQGLWGSDEPSEAIERGTKRRWTASMENQ